MSPWFSPEVASLSVFFSLLSLLACCAPLVERGRYRTLVTKLFSTVLHLGVVLSGLGLIALQTGQPAYVTRSLLLPGALLAIIFLFGLNLVRQGYQSAERRRITARDI